MQSLDENYQMSVVCSESEDTSSDGEDHEWERVPTTLQEASPPRISDASYTVSQQAQSQTDSVKQTTNIAGGLMTSAAASVASFWRVATGQRK